MYGINITDSKVKVWDIYMQKLLNSWYMAVNSNSFCCTMVVSAA